MKLLVCISVVPDTTTKIQITPEGTAADLSQVQWIINPWDELALTRAVELREKHPAQVESLTVITAGQKETEAVLRKALAIGADNAIRVHTPALSNGHVASQIASVVKNQGFDVVIAGIESSDYNGSAVGALIAAACKYPLASNISSIQIDDNALTLIQETDTGRETIRIQPPVVAVVQKGIAIEPKIPAMRGIMLARQKPLEVIQPVENEPLEEIVKLEMPAPKAPCKMINEDNVKELVALLRNESKVL